MTHLPRQRRRVGVPKEDPIHLDRQPASEACSADRHQSRWLPMTVTPHPGSLGLCLGDFFTPETPGERTPEGTSVSIEIRPVYRLVQS